MNGLPMEQESNEKWSDEESDSEFVSSELRKDTGKQI